MTVNTNHLLNNERCFPYAVGSEYGYTPDLYVFNSESPSKLDFLCKIAYVASNVLRAFLVLFSWRRLSKDRNGELSQNEHNGSKTTDPYEGLTFIRKLTEIRSLGRRNVSLRERDHQNNAFIKEDVTPEISSLNARTIKRENNQLIFENAVYIRDPKLMFDPNFAPKELSLSPDECPERGFLESLDFFEKIDQRQDERYFAKKFNEFGLFKNKYIEVIGNSNQVLTVGKSRKSQGKKMLANLIAKKIQRIQNKLISINFEIKYVEGKVDYKLAPEEWWSLQSRCLKEPSELSESERASYLRDLREADEHFSWYRVSLLDQLSHFKIDLILNHN